MTDPTSTELDILKARLAEYEKSRLQSIGEHLSAHHFHYVYGALLVLGLIGLGFYFGTRYCMGGNDNTIRQLEGKLTDKEKELTAANAALGKAQSTLETKDQIETRLQADNADLSKTAAEVSKKYGLSLGQLAELRAQLAAHRTDGSAGVTGALIAAKGSECGACKGEVRFGKPESPYARCTFLDYAALKANGSGGALDLSLGVKIDSVTMRQKQSSGSLEAVIGDVTIVDPVTGAEIAKAKLSDASKTFNAPIAGDLNRRHFYVIGGLGSQNYKLGLATQKGIRPLWWGATITKDWNAQGRLGAEILLGWQLR